MRVTRQQSEQNRQRVIAAAARLLRERGIDGIGVDALAGAAGLTHGAVYSHFKSKDELAAEAVRHALGRSLKEWLALVDGLDQPQALERLTRAYVSRAHRDEPGIGCSVAALGATNRRGGSRLKQVFRDGIATMIEAVATLSPGRTAREKREAAIVNAAAMVGAVVMARAAIADEALSDEILKTVRDRLVRPSS